MPGYCSKFSAIASATPYFHLISSASSLFHSSGKIPLVGLSSSGWFKAHLVYSAVTAQGCELVTCLLSWVTLQSPNPLQLPGGHIAHV